MSDFIQDFIYYILSFQEKLLSKKLKRNFKSPNSTSTYSNSTSKKVYGSSAILDLTVQTEKNKEKAKQNVSAFLKKYGNDSQKLIEYIEKCGTKVYRIPYADKILKLIGYETGLITGLKGFKAIYLNICLYILGQDIYSTSKAAPIFVLKNTFLDNCYMIQQFHKWYSMKLALPGFDAESQENFQKFLYSSKDEKLGELSIDEILGLKEAIARDVEAINFVVELVKSTDGSKKALKKITAGGASV